MTMSLVSTVEISSGGVSSIQFSSIPQTGLDLLIVCSLRSTRSSSASQLSISTNGAGGTGSAKTYRNQNNGDSTSNIFIVFFPAASSTSNTFGSASFYLTDYQSSNTKALSVEYVQENNTSSTNQETGIVAANNNANAAITSFAINDLAGNFAQYSTASLYIIS
jgi:hypothetical protein